ncbi:CopG family ribbon-helix-helix protein [Enterovirga aerilata]|uniref:CopG family transcriptional regulator n=1 Tax=Enterovirga aerilata TaxID=2730920 RepID=A0A849I6W0_9HYPH|nr:CopG family transcriptional regulator [Enterovirga sp. DB1703]NNM73118.1 CopG family transcriptional regulator [Enterovirga sp. DB1703]
MSAALTVQIDETVLARLEALAAERGTTREHVVQMAVADLVSSVDSEGRHFEDWQLALIDEGLAAAEKGDFAADEEVEAVFSKYRA